MFTEMETSQNDQVLKIALDGKYSTTENLKLLLQTINQAQNLKNIRCIVIVGQGTKFLDGDLTVKQKTSYEEAFFKNKIPVIFGINGICRGIEKDLLEKADLAIATTDSEIEGYKNMAAAAEAYAVNEQVPLSDLNRVLDSYVKRLIEIPEPLISYGHKIYFAMEKLPDKQLRSRYGATVIDEIMSIQAGLNRQLREKTGESDPYSGVQPDEAVAYKRAYDRDHAILFEIRNDVEYIQINAPRYRNMIDWRSSMELAGAYALANSVPSLKAIVVTGTGKRFHLGGIRHEQDDEYEQERFSDQLKLRNQIMREIKVPLISAVNGECSGGGMSLVLKSNLVIAAESARFGYPEVKHNGFACNSMVNTMGIIPKKAALKSFYYGDLFTAWEAKKFGIVHRVVPEGELDQAVAEAIRNL